MTERERDACNALLVTLALAPRPDRLRKVGIDMLALCGEALRRPVDALLASAQASGRAQVGVVRMADAVSRRIVGLPVTDPPRRRQPCVD